MPKSTLANLKVGAFAVGLALCAAMLAVMSCNDSSDGGGSTISGQVTSFTAAGAAFYAQPQPSGLQQVLQAAADLLVTPAFAAAPGVQVQVAGTDLTAMTQADGSFVIFDVPAGLQTLVFTFNGASMSLDVNVPERSKVELENVRVTSSGVNVSNIRVEIEPEDNANGNDDGANNNAANGNDDNGNDDNANDDNMNDNNANDDNGNDDNDNNSN